MLCCKHLDAGGGSVRNVRTTMSSVYVATGAAINKRHEERQNIWDINRCIHCLVSQEGASLSDKVDSEDYHI